MGIHGNGWVFFPWNLKSCPEEQQNTLLKQSLFVAITTELHKCDKNGTRALKLLKKLKITHFANLHSNWWGIL